MRRPMALLMGLAVLASTPSFAGDLTAEQILREVSVTYHNLKSFRLVEDHEVRAPMMTRGPEMSLGHWWLFGPLGNFETDLAESRPGKVRLAINPAEGGIQLISNGATTWIYLPSRGEYESFPGAPLLEETSGRGPFYGGDTLIRYATLSPKKGANVRGVETVRVGGKETDCYVIDLRPDGGFRRLWVDKQRFIVLRDVLASGALGYCSFSLDMGEECGGPEFHSSQLREVNLGPVADSLFEFVPPTTARRVEYFSSPWTRFPWSVQEYAERIMGAAFDAHLLGKRARDFTLPSLDGTSLRLHTLRGKIVVLYFYASWCKPCQNDMAEIQELRPEMASKGVVFLGIDDEEPETVRKFVKAKGYTFPMLLDRSQGFHYFDGRGWVQTVQEMYGTGWVPTVVVINRKGKIAARYVGAGGEAELRRHLEIAGLKPSVAPKPH